MNMNKTWEALENIKKTLEFIDFKSRNGLGVYANQTDLNIIEKDLKALEIIKNKCSPYLLDLLTKEEYDLLKEVLENDK